MSRRSSKPAMPASCGRTRLRGSYFPDAPAHQAIGARYLRDNIKYTLGDDERAGLELFFRYASEIGAVARAGPLQFF